MRSTPLVIEAPLRLLPSLPLPPLEPVPPAVSLRSSSSSPILNFQLLLGVSSTTDDVQSRAMLLRLSLLLFSRALFFLIRQNLCALLVEPFFANVLCNRCTYEAVQLLPRGRRCSNFRRGDRLFHAAQKVNRSLRQHHRPVRSGSLKHPRDFVFGTHRLWQSLRHICQGESRPARYDELAFVQQFHRAAPFRDIQERVDPDQE